MVLCATTLAWGLIFPAIDRKVLYVLQLQFLLVVILVADTCGKEKKVSKSTSHREHPISMYLRNVQSFKRIQTQFGIKYFFSSFSSFLLCITLSSLRRRISLSTEDMQSSSVTPTQFNVSLHVHHVRVMISPLEVVSEYEGDGMLLNQGEWTV